MTREEGYVTVCTQRLHYVAAGGTAGGLKVSDLPVVLVHGLGGSTMLWQMNITALAAGQRVVALDLPGHGHSDKPPGEYSVAFFSRALLSFLDALGFERVALVGHSLGGHVCMRLALDQPGRVERLVLIASGGLGREINTKFLQPLLAGLSRPATDAMLTALFYNPAFVTRSMLDATFELAAQPGAREALVAAVQSATAGAGQRESVAEYLGELTVPVMLVWGAEDGIIPVAHGRAAQEAIPGAELWVAERAGHCPQLEAAEAFNARVKTFLRGGGRMLNS